MEPRWIIYYDDDSIYTDLDGPAEKAPPDGIQGILDFHDNGTNTIHIDFDYYWWTGENWASGRLNDLERWLRAIAPGVKFGRWTKSSVHIRISKEINGRSKR